MTKRRRIVYEDDDKPHPTASFTWGRQIEKISDFLQRVPPQDKRR